MTLSWVQSKWTLELLDDLRFLLLVFRVPRDVRALSFLSAAVDCGAVSSSCFMRHAVTALSPLSTLQDMVMDMDICSEGSFSHSFLP